MRKRGGIELLIFQMDWVRYRFEETIKSIVPVFHILLKFTAVPDSFLFTGEKAMRIVEYIYGRGELFYDDYPHIKSLLRNQKERKENRLDGHILKSLRYGSPFFRGDLI